VEIVKKTTPTFDFALALTVAQAKHKKDHAFIAEAAGVTYNTVTRLRTGKTRGMNYIIPICKALEIEVSKFAQYGEQV